MLVPVRDSSGAGRAGGFLRVSMGACPGDSPDRRLMAGAGCQQLWQSRHCQAPAAMAGPWAHPAQTEQCLSYPGWELGSHRDPDGLVLPGDESRQS